MSSVAIIETLLEKAAFDNGFDRALPEDGPWLAFGSARTPLRLWVRPEGEAGALLALSQHDVAHELGAHADLLGVVLPRGAVAARFAADALTLHRLLRRAFQLTQTLPHAPLREFEQRTASLPKTTEAERWEVQRVGQGIFRDALLAYWEGRCAVTGLAVPELLRASHIKPWKSCQSDAERLDVFNGLLLAPHFDVAFDQGFITVEDDGGVTLSTTLPIEERAHVMLDRAWRVPRLTDGHRRYLRWHRERVFRGS